MTSQPEQDKEAFIIPINEIWIESNPSRASNNFNVEYMHQLTLSIQSQGLIQSLSVVHQIHPEDINKVNKVNNPKDGSVTIRRFKLKAGNHRLEAIKRLNWTHVSVKLSKTDNIEVNAIENLLRKPMTLEDEINFIKVSKQSSETLAQRLCKTRRWVLLRMGLINVPNIVIQELMSANLNEDQLDYVIAHYPDKLKDLQDNAISQLTLANIIQEARVRRVRNTIKRNYLYDSTRRTDDIKRKRTTKEIQKVIDQLLFEAQASGNVSDFNLNIQFCKLFGWMVGNTTDKDFQDVLDTLRNKKSSKRSSDTKTCSNCISRYGNCRAQGNNSSDTVSNSR